MTLRRNGCVVLLASLLFLATAYFYSTQPPDSIALTRRPSSAARTSQTRRINWDKGNVHLAAVKLAERAVLDFPVVPKLGAPPAYPRPDEVLHNPIRLVPYNGKEFNVADVRDVIVLLHIQKTAGTTLNRMLAERLGGDFACRCRYVRTGSGNTSLGLDWKHCKCYRPGANTHSQWLFSRTTTGWRCGLHPTFSGLTECLASGRLDAVERQKTLERSFFLATILRRPIDRFISELGHVQRGVTWRNASHLCNGVKLSHTEMPPCYSGRSWSDATLEAFTSCPYNLAANRQTRMLANLSLVNCYASDSMPAGDYNERVLDSAKRNLEAIAWFGLTEYINESLEMFEDRFGVRFSPQPLIFASGKARPSSKSDEIWNRLTDEQLKRVVHSNILDLRLYDFAEQLFLSRYKKLKAKLSRMSSNPGQDTLFDLND